MCPLFRRANIIWLCLASLDGARQVMPNIEQHSMPNNSQSDTFLCDFGNFLRDFLVDILRTAHAREVSNGVG